MEFMDQFRRLGKVGSIFFWFWLVGSCVMITRVTIHGFAERSQVDMWGGGNFDRTVSVSTKIEIFRNIRQILQQQLATSIQNHMFGRFLRSAILKLHDPLTDSASWQIITKDIK